MKKSKKKRASRAEAVKPTTLVDKKGVTPLEWVGWVVLALAVIAALAVSWRKWPDPIVDFGRELYLPWQITQGGVLYRDMDAVFGPLSQYFNALVFWLFGPGFVHLVAVNLVIYAGIVVLLYHILRVGWGRVSAFVGTMFYIAVFSFNQFVGIGNYNFAAPYAHETTHGFLLILALVATLAAWLRKPQVLLAGLAGLLWGLCFLLKIEIIFTASLVTVGALVLTRSVFLAKRNELKPARQIGAFLIAAICPPAIATIALFTTGKFSFGEAVYYANSSITGLLSHIGIVTEPAQASLLGFTNFGANLISIILAGGVSFVAFAGVAVSFAWITESRSKLLWPACIAISAFALYLSMRIPWLEAAKSFPIWLASSALMLLWRTPSAQIPETRQIRWLLLLAACGLLARMVFNPRIYHSGYYQASLAGVVTLMAAWKMIPDLFKLNRSAKICYLISLIIFLGTGVWQLQAYSIGIYSKKNQPLGTGADEFFGFDVNVEPTTALLEDARKTLAADPDFQRLVVIPEGVTLNYLLRKQTPGYAYMFHPFSLVSRDRIMAEFNTTPPDYVLLISRDMREHGILRFGESPEHGSQLLSWIDWNCSVARQVGGNPLDVNQRGAILFRRISGK